MPKKYDQVIMKPKKGKGQVAAYTGTAGTITNAVSTGVDVVMVRTTTDAYVAVVSGSEVATSADFPTVANETYWFTVSPGAKVSAIQQSSGGNLLVCEMTQ